MPRSVYACIFMLTLLGCGALASRLDFGDPDQDSEDDFYENVLERIRIILSGNFAEEMQGHEILGFGLTRLRQIGNTMLLSDASTLHDAESLTGSDKGYLPVMDTSFKKNTNEVWPVYLNYLKALGNLPRQLLPQGKWVTGKVSPIIVHEKVALQIRDEEVADARGFAHLSLFWEYDEGNGPEFLAVHFDRGTSGNSEALADVGLYETSAKVDMGLWRSFLFGTAKAYAGVFQKKTPFGKLDQNKGIARESLFGHIRNIVDTISNYDLVDQQRTTHLFMGHSLGGAISAISGMMLKERGHSKVAVVSTNSPAVMQLGHQFKLFKPSTSAVGFVNLVHQHDLVWTIDRPLHGQQICMYMQPPNGSLLGCAGMRDFKEILSVSGGLAGDSKKFFAQCFPRAHNFHSDLLDEAHVGVPRWTVEQMLKMAGVAAKPEFNQMWICTDKVPKPEELRFGLDLNTVLELSWFFSKDLLTVQGKQFKCCVHSGGEQEHILVDIMGERLTRVRHGCIDETGCGCMYGDGWHSFNKVGKKSCKQTLGYISARIGMTPQQVLGTYAPYH